MRRKVLPFMPNQKHPNKKSVTYHEFSDVSTTLKMVALQRRQTFTAVLVEAIHDFAEKYANGDGSPCRLGEVLEHKNKISHTVCIWKSDFNRLEKIAAIERVPVGEIIRRATNSFCARIFQRGTDNKAA